MTGNDRDLNLSFCSFLAFYRLDDLLIGAPLYTVKKDGRILPDAGRVDVFYQTPEVCFFCFLKNMISMD